MSHVFSKLFISLIRNCRVIAMFTAHISSVMFLFFIGFVHAFAITDLLTLPALLAILIVINSYSANFKIPIVFMALILLLFVTPNILGVFFSPHYITMTTLNHTLSFILAPIIYFSASYFALTQLPKSSFRYLRYGWFIFNLFAIFEFFIVNFTTLSLNAIVPRPTTENYEPLVFGLVVRARSFAEESAHAALFSGIFFIMLTQKRLLKWYDTIIFSVAFILFWGTTSIIAMAVVIALKLCRIRRFSISIILYGISLIVGISMFYHSQVFQEYNLLLDIFGKFNSTSSSDRLIRLAENFVVLDNLGFKGFMFGAGPGYYVAAGTQSIVGFYFLLLFQAGFCGLILWLLLIIILITFDIKSGGHNVLILLFFSICMLTISNYWFPWFWFISAKIAIDYRRASSTLT